MIQPLKVCCGPVLPVAKSSVDTMVSSGGRSAGRPASIRPISVSGMSDVRLPDGASRTQRPTDRGCGYYSTWLIA